MENTGDTKFSVSQNDTSTDTLHQSDIYQTDGIEILKK